jgi:nucleotide-binding universal stress UspA family protein
MEQHGERIVIGLDDSEGSRAALRFALLDAARRGATVTVLAAFQPPEYWAVTYGGMPAMPRPATDLEEIRDAVRAAAERILGEVRAELSVPGPPTAVVAVPGPAAPVLLDAARDADLLVIGSRGRGGFASMLLGSVSLQCVLHATCPVTVVHPDRAAAEGRQPSAQHAMAT